MARAKRMSLEDYWDAGIDPPPSAATLPDRFDLVQHYSEDRGYMTRKRIMADWDRCEECGDDVGACGCDL